MENELINAMGNDDLEAMKVKYADNDSVVKLIDGILESRVREVAERKAEVDFERGIARTLTKLPHPEKVHNIYIRWGEVEVPTGEPEEEVEVVAEDGTKSTEMRQPTRKEYQWIPQVNKSVVISRGGDGVTKVSKRAITLYKRNGLALEDKGNFPSASKACEKLGLAIGGDSATRVLAREAYILEPYEGTEYTS